MISALSGFTFALFWYTNDEREASSVIALHVFDPVAPVPVADAVVEPNAPDVVLDSENKPYLDRPVIFGRLSFP